MEKRRKERKREEGGREDMQGSDVVREGRS
jgi:hypothetical protein